MRDEGTREAEVRDLAPFSPLSPPSTSGTKKYPGDPTNTPPIE
jgi:hypothetical protein